MEYIRVGSYNKKLKDYSEKERKLWRIFDTTPFEEHVAINNINNEGILRLLNYEAYFQLRKQIIPEAHQRILEVLESDDMIKHTENGNWAILNIGAILFARNLDDFKSLKRKAIRVIFYKGNTRVNTIKEIEGTKGYAAGFEGLIAFINKELPKNEIIEQALRKTVPMFPVLAIRELIANALIHQDFFISGAGPMIEIFENRVEITNPGTPLIETSRFLDNPPRSRNERLASFMRRVGICEERGSGIDKVVFETEIYQLPAPLFEKTEDSMRVILFVHKPLNKMDRDDRIRACYLHACLKFVMRDYMTNSSLRERFGIAPQNSAVASRIIKETQEEKLIRLYEADTSRKYMKYVPYWG